MIVVSVILVVRNEQKYIERCLGAIEAQFSDASNWELILVDGLSSDETVPIAKSFLHGKPYQWNIIENPKKILASGWNLGIQHAVGQFVIRPDGHSMLLPGYIANGVLTLNEKSDVVAVGGVLITKAEGFWGGIIKEALSTKVGVGNSSFRTAKENCYADTAVYALYRRSIFSKVGHFNESMIRHQDNEMHHRILSAGGKFFLNIEMKAYYFSRNTISALLNQMFNIGKHLPTIMLKRAASLRHLIPFLFYGSLSLLLCAGVLFNKYFSYAACTIFALYLTFIILEACKLMIHKKMLSGGLIVIVIPLMHIAYAFGTAIGWIILPLSSIKSAIKR